MALRQDICGYCRDLKLYRGEVAVECPSCRKVQKTKGDQAFRCCGEEHHIGRNVHAHNERQLTIFENFLSMELSAVSIL